MSPYFWSIILSLMVISVTIHHFWKCYINLTPISVNYHFSRRCNFSSGFCFHTAKTSFILFLEDAKRGLAMLKKAGTRKINFAGGEPFLYPEFLGECIRYCKEIKIESVSIFTNGSLVTRGFLQQYGPYIDILAVSCDSFNATVA